MKRLAVALIGVPVAGATVATILYTRSENSKTINENNGQNIADVNLNFSQTIIHMNNLTNVEAQTIRTNLTQTIINAMNNFMAELNIDYEIVGLNDIQEGVNLDVINVTIISKADSLKIHGQFLVSFTWKENIDSWSIDSPISIPSNQADNLPNFIALNIKNSIIFLIMELMNLGQGNILDEDYTIENINLITAGAAFADYQNQLSVKAIPGNAKLIGQFSITFVIGT